MNQADFEALYREHYGRVYGLCRRMLGDVQDAEDAAQEVFMRGYRAIGRYRARDPFGPWISAVAGNYCIDVLRRRKRLTATFSDAAADEAALADPEKTQPERLISSQEADVVNRAVEALPEKYRIPIVLAYFADASYQEIADTLGITPNHVGVLLLRGKQHLRQNFARATRPVEEEI